MAICNPVINNPLMIIGGLTLTEVTKYDVNYSKLWADADRNMNGDVSSTFIGVFPNIDVSTLPISQANVGTLCAALDQPYFSCTFWDPSSGTMITRQYYASDYKISLANRMTGMYATVDFSVVPVSKR